MKLLFRLILLVGVLSSEVWTQTSPSTDFIVFECKRSLLELRLASAHVLNKYVSFSAVDRYGRTFIIDDMLATQCGYTISHDFWGNIAFRASLLSCYTQVGDGRFTVTVAIAIAPYPDMSGSVMYKKQVSCPYVWDAREILCETNYMEVSVRRKIPLIAESAFQNEPEDWSSAFPEAVSGLLSVWQVVFHLPSTRKAMLVSDAQKIGYGINTTETRILLRSPYNATESQLRTVGGISFSTVRSTIFYKQRWLILLVDTAVACPVDGVRYVDGNIIWIVPKNQSPLLIGGSGVKNSRIEFGVNLVTLTTNEILKRNYMVVDNNQATIITVPIGAKGGYFKSHVISGGYGINYNIDLFLENVWEDNRWGLTKYTVIKEVRTPFVSQPATTSNETIPSTRLFNVTIGTFLPDVELVNVTVGLVTRTVVECITLGYTISSFKHDNGSVSFRITVPFDDLNVKKEYIPEITIGYTLNITFGFKIIPQNEPFTSSAIIIALVPDAVLPIPYGYCDEKNFNFMIKRGNVDANWVPFIKNMPLTQETVRTHGLQFSDNGTHVGIVVPRLSTSVTFEGIHSSGVTITLPLTLYERSTGRPMYNISLSCPYRSKAIECYPNGTMTAVVFKLSIVPDMNLSQLTLRNKACTPVSVTQTTATFVFTVNSCHTTRKFNQTTMTYENEILYYRDGMAEPALKLHVACHYKINETLVVNHGYENNPAPSAQTAPGPLALVMRLSKDISYTTFYGDHEYPVVKYLMDALYFEVELLYNEDPQLELFLEHCWATASPEESSFPKWDVVVNSCEFTEAHKTIFHPVMLDVRVKYPSHLKRFEVKMFTFMEADRAYLGEIASWSLNPGFPMERSRTVPSTLLALAEIDESCSGTPSNKRLLCETSFIKELNALKSVGYFSGIQKIYFHCSVIICNADHLSSDPLCTRSCIPSKQRVGILGTDLTREALCTCAFSNFLYLKETDVTTNPSSARDRQCILRGRSVNMDSHRRGSVSSGGLLLQSGALYSRTQY